MFCKRSSGRREPLIFQQICLIGYLKELDPPSIDIRSDGNQAILGLERLARRINLTMVTSRSDRRNKGHPGKMLAGFPVGWIAKGVAKALG